MSMWDEKDDIPAKPPIHRPKLETVEDILQEVDKLPKPHKHGDRAEKVSDVLADKLDTMNKLIADILQRQADEVVRHYTAWQFRIACWEAVKTKLRKGKRPEQQALCEMMDSLMGVDSFSGAAELPSERL